MKEQIRSHVERNLIRKGAGADPQTLSAAVGRIASQAEAEYDRLVAGGKTDLEAYRGAMESVSEETEQAAATIKGSAQESEEAAEDKKGKKDKKEDAGEKDTLSPVEQTAHAVLWLLTVAAYLAVSIIFGHWNATWLLFLSAAAGSIVIDVVFDINRGHTIVEEWDNVVGIVWLAVIFIYFAVSFLTKAWGITWVIFIGGVALTIILDNVKKALVRRSAQNADGADGGSDDEEE